MLQSGLLSGPKAKSYLVLHQIFDKLEKVENEKIQQKEMENEIGATSNIVRQLSPLLLSPFPQCILPLSS
jgi:hypothetical protein